jgi:chromosome segregation ATPase
MFGTTHPEVAREQRRKQLENQRTKLREQYDQLEQSRVRLESAIATADAEVDTLRKRIDALNQPGSNGTTEPATGAPPPTQQPRPKYPEAPPPN